jgi:hypothetical protein
VQVLSRILKVDDSALAGEHSVTDLLEKTQPHALISLGQRPNGGASQYQLISEPDDGELQHDSTVRHHGALERRQIYPRNESLFRAIVRGWRPDW